ncbi:ABC transporter ATP-binding protein [Cohnella thailandensis]|uniref:ATP-binding cassette domain-containing protein n=1 Tax=Cohnella thailandensis TaxID=557557 RepID=A0A841T736_9BACL|nr:ATP-binding cassette domain-containing protein [Cohnella thailandensis]MBB6636981.1 ATP-binding cassette domain-containing protein [Cohnella thailandensis]MBP1973136.1 energy-coupling factor transport system ATP-binding protein [Cohnella thailandensis]
MEIYRIENLTFSFPEQENSALSSIDLSIRSGEFVTICGKSGCGKSTLLRHLKPALTPHGRREGEILYRGKTIGEWDARTLASEIGYVLQSPDNQIVTDKVWHELAFGLESLGFDTPTIRLRVAEMASFFGIQTWFRRDVAELSGGQKQLLNLASVMAMHPAVLVLDEPTSQLDPIAAAEFLGTLSKINRELGTTIVLTEHRLEEVLPVSDRLIVLDQGSVIADDTPRAAGEKLQRLEHPMFRSMPSPMRIHAGVGGGTPAPLTVKEGRQWLDGVLAGTPIEKREVDHRSDKEDKRPVAIELKDVWFKFDKHAPDTIKDLSLKVREGQFFGIVGGNGTGKTTTLSLISGILKPYRGKIRVGGEDPSQARPGKLFRGRLGVLPQNPQALFVKKTVELDLLEMLAGEKLSAERKEERIREVVRFAELESLLQSHPYDLSGGEQQRAALAKVLLLEPTVLLLDEPTKGLDGFFKEKLGELLKRLNEEGKTIVMVSHDIEFCAKYAEECAMFFDGSVISSNQTAEFFAGNSFYTTSANRMARHLDPMAVTEEEVIRLCRTSP